MQANCSSLAVDNSVHAAIWSLRSAAHSAKEAFALVMSSAMGPKAPKIRQSRKSIAHVPGAEKENATLDSATLSTISSQLKEKAKKTRSKSIGPGGLDALKEGSGNRGEVSCTQAASEIFCPARLIFCVRRRPWQLSSPS